MKNMRFKIDISQYDHKKFALYRSWRRWFCWSGWHLIESHFDTYGDAIAAYEVIKNFPEYRS